MFWKFWHSVVGKLWLTIIGLVAVVLTLLSFFLIQFLEQYYYEQRSDDLLKVAEGLAHVISSDPDKRQAISNASQFLHAYDTKLAVIQASGEVISPSAVAGEPHIPTSELLAHPYIKKAIAGEAVDFTGMFPVIYEESMFGETQKLEMLVIAVPLGSVDNPAGTVIIYQPLLELSETTEKTRNLILLTAGVAIILATIFAFFLSTRITEPLRQMRKAADRFSVGQFEAKIPIRTHDEIGELASTFNKMAKQLDELVHALSSEKEKLDSVLRSMADGVLTVNTAGEIIITNPPADRLIRSWLFESGKFGETGELPEPLFPILKSVLEHKHEVSTDITIQGRVWSVIMAPLYHRNRVRGAVALVRDITEERRLDKLRKDFVANVSHELRTPISMLRGYSEALIDDVADSPEERRELAKIIYDESLRMGRLVNELLDLARLEAGHFQLHLQNTPIAALIGKIAKKFSAISKEQQIHLNVDLDQGLGTYLFDPDRMEQVLTNLVDNAIRHTSAEGNIDICVYEKGGYVHLEIKDTGAGIPEEDLPFVFERFYKADKARTRGKSGTGLGLAIVKNLIDAHGGTITVHSKLGVGTTFSILLPITVS